MKNSAEGKKSLLMTASTFPRWEGDTEPRFILDLAKALNEYFDVTVLVPAAIGAKDREIMENVKVIRYHYLPVHRWETLCYPGAIVPRIQEKRSRALQAPFLLLGLWVQLRKRRKDYDAIHAHWLIPQGVVHSFAGGKYSLTGHGGDVNLMNRGMISRMKQRAVGHAARITVVSEKLKMILQNNYHVPAEKIAVIPMGCDLGKFTAHPGKRRDSSLIPDSEGKRKIVYVGRLVQYKGVQYLIDAMAEVDADLYIVGDGPMREELERRADAYRDKIRFLGALGHEKLAEVYSAADVCCFPSFRDEDGAEEGRPTTIMEAMACGRPIVTCPTGGIVDTIHDGVNGIMAREKDAHDLATKIKMLLDDSALAERIGRQAAEDVKQYDWREIARQYADVIREIL